MSVGLIYNLVVILSPFIMGILIVVGVYKKFPTRGQGIFEIVTSPFSPTLLKVFSAVLFVSAVIKATELI